MLVLAFIYVCVCVSSFFCAVFSNYDEIETEQVENGNDDFRGFLDLTLIRI